MSDLAILYRGETRSNSFRLKDTEGGFFNLLSEVLEVEVSLIQNETVYKRYWLHNAPQNEERISVDPLDTEKGIYLINQETSKDLIKGTLAVQIKVTLPDLTYPGGYVRIFEQPIYQVKNSQ